MTSFDDVLARATPLRRTVTICVDGETVSDLARLAEQRDALPAGKTLAGAPSRKQLDAQIDELRARAEAAEVEFHVRAIGSLEWTDIMVAHQPKPGEPSLDLGLYSKGVQAGILVVNRSFVAAALAASLTEPAATEEQVAKLLATLSNGQADLLWSACLDLNNDAGEIPKSVRRSAAPNGSDEKPPTSALEESPAPSS